MAEQRIKIPRASDELLLKCFIDLVEITNHPTVKIQALGFNNIGDVNLNEDLPRSLKLIVEKNSAIIESITLTHPSFPITFHRGGKYPPEDKSGVFDEIILRQNPQQVQLDSDTLVEIILTINERLKAFDSNRVGSLQTEEQSQVAAIHNSNLERLELLNENLVKHTHELRHQLEDEYAKKNETLKSEISSQKTSLEEQYREKQKALQEEKSELEKRRKELDDKSNTHARREIRRDILKEIKSRQEKFSLTAGTNQLRKPVGVMMLALISFFVVLSIVSAREFYEVLQSDNMTKIMIAGIKQTIYSAGAVGSFIFMIRWSNKWFELHSESEFELKQFELDMERASWLVETSLEWKDAKGTSIPPELLGSLSSNLFCGEKERDDQIQHPADQLASALLGSASAVKLKSGDSLLEIDPKKLAKTKLHEPEKW